MNGPGYYEISGIAYSGNGRISRVMVSADGGKTWAQAALQEPVHSKAFAASARPGAGMAVPRSCKVAPGTKPATRNRLAPSSCRAGRDQEAGYESSRVPQPALQQHHELGDRSDGEIKHVTLKLVLAFVLALVLGSGAALAQTPDSEIRSPRRTSRPGTSP